MEVEDQVQFTRVLSCTGMKFVQNVNSSKCCLVLAFQGRCADNVVVVGVGACVHDLHRRTHCTTVHVLFTSVRGKGVGTAIVKLMCEMQPVTTHVDLGVGVRQNRHTWGFWKHLGFHFADNQAGPVGLVDKQVVMCACCDHLQRTSSIGVSVGSGACPICPHHMEDVIATARSVRKSTRKILSLQFLGLADSVVLYPKCLSTAAMFNMISLPLQYASISDAYAKSDFYRAAALLEPPWGNMAHPDLSAMASKVLRPGEVALRGSMLKSVDMGGDQSLHTDFHEKKVSDEHMSGGSKPRTLLVAMRDGCKLYVRTPKMEIVCFLMDAGDGVAFDGDVVHAGAGYECTMMRAHWYLETRPLKSRHRSMLEVPLKVHFQAKGMSTVDVVHHIVCVKHCR